MTETKTYKACISGMSCASCERMISKMVEKIDGLEVQAISAAAGEMTYTGRGEHEQAVRKAVAEAGYRLEKIEELKGEKAAGSEEADSGESAAGMSARELVRGLLNGHHRLKAERQLLLASFTSLVFLLLVLAFLFLGVWREVPKFESTYLPLLVLGAAAVVSVVGAGYHFKAYHKPISCSIGMMEGMTFGMMAGFMIGALLGATSGMFWGSVWGMVIGCIAGVWGGHSSGVMGVMEGLMAGVMAGTMGAMLSVMLLAEPLVPFLALLFALCNLILAALAYMQVKELGLLGRKAEPASISSMASLCLICFAVLSWLMIYGPKSGPVFGG